MPEITECDEREAISIQEALDNRNRDFSSIHDAQLRSLGIPERFWPSLVRKLDADTFDAGPHFQMCRGEDQAGASWQVLVINEDGLSAEDPENIFLVDHAWTCETEHAETQLQQAPALLERMLGLMDLEVEPRDSETESTLTERKVESVLRTMWKFNHVYEMRQTTLHEHDDTCEHEIGHCRHENLDTKFQAWYVMDEFGSRFQHSMTPNMAFKCFHYSPRDISYTVIYPLEDIPYGGEATRQWVINSNDIEARLYPWQPELLNLDQVEDNWVAKITKNVEAGDLDVENERLPEQTAITNSSLKEGNKVKVYSEDPTVREYVTMEPFEMTDDYEEADILWLMSHFKDFASLATTPHRRINQFGNEMVVVVKDLFTITAMRSIPFLYHTAGDVPPPVIAHRGPAWLMSTYNLYDELPQFIKNFKQMEASGQENHWIIKPWNMARGIDIVITDNLDRIIKLGDVTRPKIACKYITDPVLFHRPEVGWVKHEHRFQVFVKSADPLEVYVHDIFYLRFANHAFSLTDFDDYQKHFCIMAYKGFPLLQIPDTEYIQMFESQYPHIQWADVQRDTYTAIKDLFRSATAHPPPLGLARSPQSVAAYGVDLIYRWVDAEHTRIQPVILECNFGPQTSRGSKMYPPYWNEVFQTLFTDEPHPRMIRI